MSKVKVPAVFDKWYKQVEEYNLKAQNAAIHLIAAQGFGHTAVQDNVLGFTFDLTKEEIETMEDYVCNHKSNAIRAVLDGYEVEEQLYYIKIPYLNDQFVNYSLRTKAFFTNDGRESYAFKTKFTMGFIEEKLPEFKQYAVKVEE